jgi:hypothetical protein
MCGKTGYRQLHWLNALKKPLKYRAPNSQTGTATTACSASLFEVLFRFGEKAGQQQNRT